MRIKNWTILLLSFLALTVEAQNQWCASYGDFLAGQWQMIDGEFSFSSVKNRGLLFILHSDNKEIRKNLKKHSFLLTYSDSLYLNLRPLEVFGNDGFVRVWAFEDGRLLFARPDVAPSTFFSIGYGGSSIPLSPKMFKSKSKLENLVCYVLSPREGHDDPAISKIRESDMEVLLKDYPDLVSKYNEYPRKRREAADVVLSLLLEAGLIK